MELRSSSFIWEASCKSSLQNFWEKNNKNVFLPAQLVKNNKNVFSLHSLLNYTNQQILRYLDNRKIQVLHFSCILKENKMYHLHMIHYYMSGKMLHYFSSWNTVQGVDIQFIISSIEPSVGGKLRVFIKQVIP